jgi:hypothetical protein
VGPIHTLVGVCYVILSNTVLYKSVYVSLSAKPCLVTL